MRVRGALHVHSDLSHDGTLSIAELAGWYRSRAYHFVALAEHSQDIDESKIRTLVEQSRKSSSPEFCVIPGIEFACRGGLHIAGLGVTAILKETEPSLVIDEIHERNGCAVLAHPRRNGWNCPRDVVLKADAAEIWNLNYDGKFLPSPQSLRGFRRLRQVNPRLLAFAGHDFHRPEGFYDVAVETEAAPLEPGPILNSLQSGLYRITAPLFSCNSRAEFSSFQSARLLLMGWQIAKMRAFRDLLARWLS